MPLPKSQEGIDERAEALIGQQITEATDYAPFYEAKLTSSPCDIAWRGPYHAMGNDGGISVQA